MSLAPEDLISRKDNKPKEVSKKEISTLEMSSVVLSCKAMKAVEMWSGAMGRFDFQSYKDWDGFHLLNEQAGRMNRLMREATGEIGGGKKVDDEQGDLLRLAEKIQQEVGGAINMETITDRPKLEKMYMETIGRRIEKELEMMVSAVGGDTAELVKEGRKVEQFIGSDQAKLVLVRDAVLGVVHEVGNSITKVKGYLDFALGDADSIIELESELEKIPSYVREVAEEASLLDQILEGKLEGVEMAGEYVGKIVDTKLDRYVRGFGSVKIVSKPERDVKVRYSKVVAQMLAGTIMQNAERYVLPTLGEKGKLEFEIESDEMVVEGQKFLEISIEDNGPGYDDGRIEEGFVIGGTGGKGEGTGMAFHRRLAQSLGGELYPAKRKDDKSGARTVLRLAVV